MDEKLKQALDALLDKLTDAQKEQAKSCKTPDELMEFLGNAGVELPDELLCAVSGGSNGQDLGDDHLFSVEEIMDMAQRLSSLQRRTQARPQTQTPTRPQII